MHTYEDIISVENLLEAWQEFVRGKRAKPDVQAFQHNLMTHVLALHADLRDRTYVHGGYRAFNISDPKPRNIHKAIVRDRLLHHAIHRQLYPFFDRRFIADSFSCRRWKGTHRALDRFQHFARKVSRNHTHTAWVLKCDVRKFFASVDHGILLGILAKHVPDRDILGLLAQVIKSFSTDIPTFSRMLEYQKGLPLGNLTSQLLVNVYMNEFDQYVKRALKVRHYIRYADDFVFLSHDRKRLIKILQLTGVFLRERLKLELHPQKTSIQTVASGIDFLGWVHFPDHRVLRTATKRRMLKKVKGRQEDDAAVQSYLGLLRHGNARTLRDHVSFGRSGY
jgi:retron-type reverse transcriptase